MMVKIFSSEFSKSIRSNFVRTVSYHNWKHW